MPTQQTQQPVAPKLPSGPGPVAAFTQPPGIGLLIALAFLLIYLAALHKPQPHHLLVGVVAPPAVVAQLQRSLSTPTGDTVALRPVADAPPHATRSSAASSWRPTCPAKAGRAGCCWPAPKERR